MSEVQYTVRDAINRLKGVNALGKTNLSDKDVIVESPITTAKIVDGIERIIWIPFKSISSFSAITFQDVLLNEDIPIREISSQVNYELYTP